MIILSILITLLLGLFTVSALLFSKLTRLESKIKLMHDEYKQIVYALTELAHNSIEIHQIKEIKVTLDSLKLEQSNLNPNKTNDSAYKQALKMVEIGANMDDIVSTCSLSKAEVQLLMNLKKFDPERA